MSKHKVELSLVELYAIKHALEDRVKNKKEYFNYLKENDKNADTSELEKDINHEEFLVNKFAYEIHEYRAAKIIV